MNWTPTGNRVIVKPNNPTTVTPGGLHLAVAERERICEGTVVSAGPASTIAEQATVIWDRFTGSDALEGHIILTEEQVLAVKGA
jgi:co-chaperonin GroES (HSP10)